MARGSWRLTVRHGPKVEKLKYGSVDEALAAAREWVDRVKRQGNLPAINALRDFSPDQRVHARIEISGPGMLRPPQAGIDVMGDGSFVAYRGVLNKEALGADTLDEALERLRDALSG